MSSSNNSGQFDDPTFVRNYRGAIALNNAGVTLLERHSYRHAMDTLRDSLDIMKIVFKAREQQHGKDESICCTTNDLPDKLQLAWERLAETTTLQAPPVTPRSKLVMECLTHQDCSYMAAVHSLLQDHQQERQHAQEVQRRNVVFPIRIEVMDDDDYDPDIESAIVLYNFGLSYLGVSRTTKKGARRSRQAAFQLFSLAHSVLTTKSSATEYKLPFPDRYHNHHDGTSSSSLSRQSRVQRQQNQATAQRILMVAVLVVENIVLTLGDAGMQREAEDFELKLCHLKRAAALEMEAYYCLPTTAGGEFVRKHAAEAA